MGCGGSKAADKPAAKGSPKGDSPSSAKAKPKDNAGGSAPTAKLLDHYTLGEVLGQGAFGVVYKCEKKTGKEQFAVKMVDMAESPLAEIKKECDMLQKMAHPCVVKLHDVYYEKVFVCMVLDIIKGGDMINGMQVHWQSKGTIACEVTQNVSKQMLNSIQVLHSKNVVHRDLKGDNFLMDRKDIENPKCRVYLSDFGTVLECEPAQRLSSKCGTKLYWSPEFYSLNYGVKVDIWAIGVIMYGLVTGRFPFKGETDVRTKPIKLPGKFPKEGQDLIMGMLDRDEPKRFTAAEALEKAFMTAVKSAAWEELQAFEPGFKPEMKEGGANNGIAQRRAELVQRLQEAKMGQRGSMTDKVGDISKISGFDVVNPLTQGSIKYEWWTAAKVKEENLMDAGATQAPKEDSQHDLETKGEAIKKTLEEHNIKTDQFGKGQAKTTAEFTKEVLDGASRLMLDAASYKNIVRVVDVVLLRIAVDQGGRRYLINMSEKYPDGRSRDHAQLPGTKKEPYENGVQTAKRVILERLGMSDCQITWDLQTKECFEEEEDSPSYPGVRTVYKKEIFEGSLTTTDAKILERVGLKGSAPFKHTDDKSYERTYKWLTEAECEKNSVVYKAPKEGSEVSALVQAPVGFEEEELETFLTTQNVDVTQFGQGTNRSLQEFSAELVAGEAVLQRRPNGKMARVVDVVVLHITKKDGSVLVETTQNLNGQTSTLNRLPAVKRRSDENQFLAAHRVLSKVLRISENCVNIAADSVKYFEEEKESKGYCGLPTCYQKRFIMGTLVE